MGRKMLEAKQSRGKLIPRSVPKFAGTLYLKGIQCTVQESIPFSVEEYLGNFHGTPEFMPSTILIAKQMLTCVREMHQVGYLHQDIKPDNFRVNEAGLVKIIDFGLVMQYDVNTSGRHKGLGKYGFQGSPIFGAIRSLQGFTLSRRDDLECLGYTIMFLIDNTNENHPWIQCQTIKEIMQAKQNFLALKEDQVSIQYL
ncbi:hypothetical protein FGO68_gene8739 [Halteria grandinella]|uniref:Casein kinase I n=1 Tax=Halteria grandinella TaxID=5974 RepID=A0A8J8T3L9_HALGN|nr:hypothetical protein FGO68_gene8739 [Halteria grandinella]